MLSLLLFSNIGLAALPAGYHPVLMSGPFMGQNLEVKNDNSFTICNTGGDYKHLWINLEGNSQVEYIDDFYCISQGLKTGGWDNVNKVSKPKDNIHVRPFGYAGSTKDQLDGLTTFGGGETQSYALVVKLQSLGYKIDESLFGHTYDWRLSVRDWELHYFPVFKTMIERAVEANNGAGAVLTGISMSGQYNHAFLSWVKREVGPAWATRYIHAIVPVATGWNGAVMAASAVLDSILGTWGTDGDCPNCEPSHGMPNMSHHRRRLERRRLDGLTDWMKDWAIAIGDDLLQDMFSSFPATYTVHPGIDHSTNPPTDPEVVTLSNALAPAECSANADTATVCGAKKDAKGYTLETGFLSKDQCGECVWTSGHCDEGWNRAYDGWTQDLCCKRHQCMPRTYKASELPELYRELGQEMHAQMMEYSLTIDTTSDPGVPVHCVYSHNVQTFNGLNLAAKKENDPEELVNNVISMDDGDQTVDHASLEVCDRWASTVKTYRVNGVAHSSMLNVEQVLDVLAAVATEDQATLDNWTAPDYPDVKPQTITVDPTVLLKRTVCTICETPVELNPDAQFLDPATNKMVKCSDADAYCTRNGCGNITDLRAFFKEKTQCCNGASATSFNPAFWKLQPKSA